MLAPFLLLASYQASLQQPVQYSNSGDSIADIVSALADQTGVRLETGDDAKGQYMVLHTANRPLSEVMERIAIASASRWSVEDGVSRLVPDEAMRKGQEQKHIAARLEQRESMIRDMSSILEDLRKEDMEEEGVADAIASYESWLNIYKAVDGPTLAAMKPEDRIVFSSRPTQMQRPLPPIQNYLGYFIKEINREYEEYPGPTYEENSEELQRIRDMIAKYAFDYMSRKGEVAKVLLVASGSTYDRKALPTVELYLYDRTGRLLGSFYQDEYVDSEAYYGTTYSPETEAAAQRFIKDVDDLIKRDPKPEMPQWWQEIALESSRSYREMVNDTVIPPTHFSPETIDRIYHPTQYDPLGLSIGEALVRFGKATNQALAVTLPEVIPLAATDASPWEMLRTWFTYPEGMEISYEGSWFLIQPSVPVVHREQILDREALEILLNSGDEHGMLSYDSIAAFALRVPAAMMDSFTTRPAEYISLEKQGLDYPWAGDANMGWNALKFYGSLSKGQQNSLKRGESVAIRSLSASARTQLTTLLFGSDSRIGRPSIEDRKRFTEEFGEYAFTYLIGDTISLGDYRDEPTEAMPNGLNTNGVITGEAYKTLVVAPGKLEGDKFEWESIISLDEYTALMQSPYAAPSLFMMLGERDELRMTISVSPQAAPYFMFSSNQITDTKPHHISQVPGPYKAAYERALRNADLMNRVDR